jgi:asparagine synthase (glutamine-hydrolysing)
MCGILAFYDNNKSLCNISITNTIDEIAHRGPDGRGIFSHSIDEINITLAHLRLSILDLTSNASQPFTYKHLTLIFNGEIYNYKELRNQLIDLGYSFNSESDTEVIILGYDQWGTDIFSKLNGMFAVIIYDSLKNKLVICRDELGIKPLFYYDNKGSIIFTSEPKSLINSGVNAELNFQIISEFLQYRFREGNETFFKNIHEFPKGNIWEIQNSKISKKKFKFHNTEILQKNKSYNVVDKAEQLLLESIEKQIRADVPIGFFLSGGVDSSLLVSIYSKAFGLKANTFSVYFNNYEYSEQKYQKIVANDVRSNHIEYCSGHSDFFEDYIFSLSQSSAPHSIPNYTQVFQLSKIAKESVKVLISGEGADEIFGGYHRYQNAKISKILNSNLFSIYKFIPILNKKIKNLLLNESPDFIFKYGLEYLKINDFQKFITLPNYIREFNFNNDFNTLLTYDQDVYMRGLLERVDNMTMLAGIEARVPYLDFNLVNFLNSLNFHRKIGLFERKKIINSIAKKYLPESIVKREKIGFSVPLDSWITDSYGLGKILPIIIDEKSKSRNLFDYELLQEIIKNNDTRKKYAHNILFPILSLELWIRSVVEKEDIHKLTSSFR